MLSRLDRILPLPYPHFMAFAPLDAWLRVLTQARAEAPISPRYWPRIAAALFTSALGTALTLPERLILAPILRRAYARAHPNPPTPHAPRPTPPSPLASRLPPIVFVLGYYRSGTTHLHYLLSCDPALITPRWYQMLAPQGFALSWGFLRWFLVPFLSTTRPQDDVAYGSEYPAEDDFGVCNWAAVGTMPGRMVVPSRWSHYKRYHTLDGLTPCELDRFRRAQFGLTWKLGTLNPRRAILLKTPAHTARVRALVDLYGDRARFIHLHRDPTPVLRSNVAMHRRFAPFLLQPHPGDDEIRRRVVEEYDATERAFLAQSAELEAAAPGRVARIRYEALIADPVGEVHRAYSTLNLPLSEPFAAKLVEYLDTVKGYRAADRKNDASKSDGRDAVPPAPELGWMHAAFGHDRLPIPARDPRERAAELGLLPPAATATPTDTEPPLLTGPTAAMVTAVFCLAAWLLTALLAHDRMDWLAWPTGVAVGLAALSAAGRGTARLGLIAAALTLLTILATALPATWLADYATRRPVPWEHVWLSTRRGVLATNNALWLALGLMSAYRYASRAHVRPPGL